MLDDEDPLTLLIFAAARAEDQLLGIAQKMTLASSAERLKLRSRCRTPLADLRQLASDHFRGQPRLPELIDALEAALDDLSHLAVDPAILRSSCRCPVCGTQFASRRCWGLLPPRPSPNSSCLKCLETVLSALALLEDGAVGFGTDAI